MKRDYIDYLEDILKSINNIKDFTKGLTYKDFVKDEKTSLAVIKSIEIIGEAVKKVPNSIKNKYPDVEWKKISGMRDILVHEYFGVDMKILWRVIRRRIASLGTIIRTVIQKEEKGKP
ncbi:MAG: DUF86 domain-containing protein [Planctomycetota bacterium]|nr:DUF86 domain-containing protein [Planctomycetota bacterium]